MLKQLDLMMLRIDSASKAALLVPALGFLFLGIFLVISQHNTWVRQTSNNQYYEVHGAPFKGKIVEFSDVKTASQRAQSSRSAVVFVQILPNQGLTSPTYLQLERIGFVSKLTATDLQEKWVGQEIPLQCNLEATRCRIQLNHELNQPHSLQRLILFGLLGTCLIAVSLCLIRITLKIQKSVQSES